MLRAPERLLPDLMDVYRLFPAIDLEQRFDPATLKSEFFCEGEVREICDAPLPGEAEHCRPAALEKRYAKLALYRFLSEKTGKKLPWGSLTGIRPTRLAYAQLPDNFRPLFTRLGVSGENIELVSRVLEAQTGLRDGDGTDLYLSIPFCPTKCVYCSFITAPIEQTRQYLPAYLNALEAELAAARKHISKLRSVYVGGGTPFVLDPPDLERVLRALQPLPAGCEFTVEAGRPDVFSREKLDLCAKYGVTRICINAQSFSDRTLRAIGRRHTAEDVHAAFRMAQEYSFDVNCDLIAGLTGESFEEFCGSVNEAISLSPANITVHTLCLKRGARLTEERLETERSKSASVRPLDDGALAEMITYSRAALTQAGYEPYYLYRQKYMAGAHENVGWTKPRHACRYNIGVMEELRDNLAVGANAVSKRVFPEEGRIERYGAPKDIPSYIAKIQTIIEDKNKFYGA